MKKNEPYSDITKNIEELQWEIQDYKSNLQLVHHEIAFMNNMLDAYIFEPDTPNLFERLQEYKAHLKKSAEKKQEVQNQISNLENNIAALLERNETTLDLMDFQKHEKLKNSFKSFMNDYQKLKTEFYNYTGGILKKYKP